MMTSRCVLMTRQYIILRHPATWEYFNHVVVENKAKDNYDNKNINFCRRTFEAFKMMKKKNEIFKVLLYDSERDKSLKVRNIR